MTVYPGIDLSYRPHQDWTVHASYNTSLRMPSFTEMYYKVQGYKADPHLKPEEMRAWETGVGYHNRQMHLSLTGWLHNGRNMIDWIMDTTEGADAVWQSVNHTKINSIGMEVAAEFNFREILPSQHLLQKIDISYSYIDQDKEQEATIVSQYALEYLRHKLVAHVLLQLMPQLAMTMNLRWQDRVGTYTDFDGQVNNYAPYALLDARLTYQQPKWQVYAEANNIFDTRYHDFGLVEEPGRWLTAGLRLTL